MGAPPYFTILIPTKGRANQLRFALASLLMQDFGDFEVIVLDSDPTGATAKAFYGGWQCWLDHRFRLVGTGDVWMSQNCEVGLSHARGRYVHVCQDKGILCREALRELHVALERERCDSLVFDLVSHHWESNPAQVVMHPYAGLEELQYRPEFHLSVPQPVEPRYVQSVPILSEFLVQGWEVVCYRAPRAFNCVTSLQRIQAIRSGGVPFFDVTSPDLCSALRLLDHLEGFHVADAKLGSHYWGSEASFGTSWRYGFDFAAESFVKLGPAIVGHMNDMPVGAMPLFHNGIFADYVHVRRSARGNLQSSRLRSSDYFNKLLQDVAALHMPAERQQRLLDIVERHRQHFAAEFI